MNSLANMVSKSLGVSAYEADTIIEEQARIGLDMMTNGNLTIEDVDDLMMDMGVEPDLMDEFLLRMV